MNVHAYASNDVPCFHSLMHGNFLHIYAGFRHSSVPAKETLFLRLLSFSFGDMAIVVQIKFVAHVLHALDIIFSSLLWLLHSLHSLLSIAYPKLSSNA